MIVFGIGVGCIWIEFFCDSCCFIWIVFECVVGEFCMCSGIECGLIEVGGVVLSV